MQNNDKFNKNYIIFIYQINGLFLQLNLTILFLHILSKPTIHYLFFILYFIIFFIIYLTFYVSAVSILNNVLARKQ